MDENMKYLSKTLEVSNDLFKVSTEASIKMSIEKDGKVASDTVITIATCLFLGACLRSSIRTIRATPSVGIDLIPLCELMENATPEDFEVAAANMCCRMDALGEPFIEAVVSAARRMAENLSEKAESRVGTIKKAFADAEAQYS